MSDKDVTRNVRGSGKEGIQTPKQKHFHSLSEKNNIPLGKGKSEQSEKDRLLQKFKKREESWKKESQKGEKEKKKDIEEKKENKEQ